MQPTPYTCNRCNAPLPPGATQCPNCGQTFPSPVPVAPPAYGQPGYAPPPAKGKSPLAICGIIAAVGCLPVLFILAAILFPVFSKAREKARETVSVSNLKIIGLASLQFAEDHDEHLPPTDSMAHFQAALAPYVQQDKIQADKLYVEPGADAPYTLNARVSKAPLGNFEHPEKVELAREAVPHADGLTAVLYADGRVHLLRPDGTSSDSQ